jgi:FKBP-type peptidyl-prolyl cis-trans isomerase
VECDDPNFTYTQRGDTAVSSSTLRFIDLTVGTGGTATLCNGAGVQYVGRLTTGEVFDSSATGLAFRFTPGVDRVISGFAEGVLGMKVGGSRRLIIPPSLGYGATAQPSQGAGFAGIPANSTIIFDIKLVEIQ